MTKRELNLIDVLARLDGGRLTSAAAADLMRLASLILCLEPFCHAAMIALAATV
jgi:hypothetical protein